MNLRNRALLLIGMTFIVFIIIIAAVSLSVTLSGLDRIEHQDMAESVNQTTATINAESASLLINGSGLGMVGRHVPVCWRHRIRIFSSQCQSPKPLLTLNLNLFMIIDENGNLLHGQILSPDFQTNESVPADLRNLIRNNPGISYSSWLMIQGLSGLLITPKGPMVVASVPILQSDRTRSRSWDTVIGRYLESDPIRRISDMTGFNITLDWQGNDVPEQTCLPDL